MSSTGRQLVAETPRCFFFVLLYNKSLRLGKQNSLLPSKLMKVGIFLELDTLDSYAVYFARFPSLHIVCGFALLALAHEMFNWIIIV